MTTDFEIMQPTPYTLMQYTFVISISANCYALIVKPSASAKRERGKRDEKRKTGKRVREQVSNT